MERQPHNNPWAEKLLQVSMPDSGDAWTAMEAILDTRMPRSRTKDRRRWVLLILLLLLLIGVCNCPGRGRLFHNAWTTRTTAPIMPAATVPTKTARTPTPTPATPARSTVPPAAAAPTIAANPPAKTRAVIPRAAPPAATPVADLATKPALTKQTYSPARIAFKSRNPSGPARNKTPKHRTPKPARPTPSRGPATTRPETETGITDSSELTPATATAKRTAKPTTTTDTITQLPKKPALKDSTHKKPAPKPQPPQPEKEKQNGWVIGIGLNQFFPIGGQQGSSFNSSGLTGTLSDYLPVPMIRYYFNPKVYLQLEAQYNTPQATKKNLVISAPLPDTAFRPGNILTSTASLRQLYYFNIPLSIHFSPLKNVDVGTGLQWSHLSNAIGSFDSSLTSTTGGNPALVDAKSTRSFKGDTLYRHIRTNEFRFLLDVNYTYKHFIFGLRYNQALSNFVNIQFATGQVTQSRNSSLQLYLRYILFDSRKKNVPQQAASGGSASGSPPK